MRDFKDGTNMKFVSGAKNKTQFLSATSVNTLYVCNAAYFAGYVCTKEKR